MLSVIIPTIIANLATTGCALLLVRRGPTRRLKTLTLTVGLMSLAQTAGCLHAQGLLMGTAPYLAQVHQLLAAGLSLIAIFLLAREVFDRGLMDRKLRLAEHEIPITAVKVVRETLEPAAPQIKVMKPVFAEQAPDARRAKDPVADTPEVPASRGDLHKASMRATTDLLLMLNAVSVNPSAQPDVNVAAEMEECPQCREIARDMASAWLELHLRMEIKGSHRNTPGIQDAGRRVMQILHKKQLHESQSRHELPLLTEPRLPRLALVTQSSTEQKDALVLSAR
jgi:hypothetical protein